ncbi:Glycosyltransferase_(GlcNAc) (plasmid) [Leishmania braziliensis MHOM/BR/75/M2904]|nr:Glycosyltransferase_(GlcNAc) [Leishmania braziliensis MHOM/BR/75/M2904]
MDAQATARVKRVPPPSLFGDSLDGVVEVDAAVLGDAAPRMAAGTASRRNEYARGLPGFAPASMALSDEGTDRLPPLAQALHGSPHRQGPAYGDRRAAAGSGGYASTHLTGKATTGAATSVHSRSDLRLLKRLLCCASRVHRMLRLLGFVNDDDDPADVSQTLVCACTAVGALLVLLLINFAALVVVLVVMVPAAQRQLPQTAQSLLDFNHENKSGTADGAALASGLDIRRLLAGGGLETFLREAHRAEELRRRVQGNATLLAALRKANEARNNDGGRGVDLVRLAQTLPELEYLSFLLYQVSAHVQAVQERDPVMGLVELSDFLLNAKGRREALEKAAERARAEAVNATTAATVGGGARATGGGSVEKWNAALKESFAGRSEAARLRAQLRGFIGVASSEAERLTQQPFDDLALLQYRHAWMQSEVLPIMRSRSRRAGAQAVKEGPHAAVLRSNTASRPPENTSVRTSVEELRVYGVANRMAMKAVLYEVASIFNHIYYYPLRRYEALRPYGGDSVADTDAWYSAITAAVQTRFGVPIACNKAQTTEAAALPLVLRDSPLSVLALSRLGFRRAEEVAHLYSQEDRQLMPQALNPKAAVNVRSIFVSFASYRDAECASTLLDLFRAARNPHRLYVGIAQQNRAGDSPCLVPEMYTPYLCPSEGLQGAAADGGVGAARESRARARALYGEGADLTKPPNGPEARHFDERVCFLAEQVRVREIDSGQAKGPTYGRYMAMLLYRGEGLALVLDSHNRFRPMWDALGATMLLRLEDAKAVLSHYPESYPGEKADLLPYRRTTAYLCRAHFLKPFGYIRLNGIVIDSTAEFAKNNVFNDPYVRVKSREIDPTTNYRLPQPWVAGGFLMAFGTIFRDVPFDPHLSYIFDGEEVLYSMRLWTHGYNLYSPPRGVCFHIYGRQEAPKVWSESALWYNLQNRVRSRIQFYVQAHLLHAEKVLVPANSTNPFVVMDSSRYGMGKQRTVAQWYDYAGIDPVKHQVDGRWCGEDVIH